MAVFPNTSLWDIFVPFFHRKFWFVFLPFVVALSIDMAPFYLDSTQRKAPSETVKIVCINVLSSNGNFDAVEKYLKEKDPDLIVLQEFTTLWQLMIGPKLNEYSYRLEIPRSDNFGIAVLSKTPISNLEEFTLGVAEVPSIRGDIVIGDTQVKFIATHPLPPVGRDYFDHRNSQLNELGSYVAGLTTEAIVIGDLNTSSFSVHFKDLISRSKLTDTRRGFGRLTTWPAEIPIVRTTLDHCLVTSGLVAVNREVGADIGSDHLPIFVELAAK